MVGLWRLVGAVVIALTVASCGSVGVSPKAFGGGVQPAASPDAKSSYNAPDAEPVVVAPDVVNGWEFLYRNVTQTEFVLCLEGSRQDGKIVVDGFRLARMDASTVNSVRYEPCTSARYVGTAHNHPPVDDPGKSLCYQSEPDRRSFGMDNRAVVDIVLCGDNKFLWVLKDGRSAARTVE